MSTLPSSTSNSTVVSPMVTFTLSRTTSAPLPSVAVTVRIVFSPRITSLAVTSNFKIVEGVTLIFSVSL